MSKMFKFIKKNTIFCVFILILIFLFPYALYSPGENKIRGIVTAIGIDKVESSYEISLLTFIPTANQSFQQKNSVISATGETIANAIYNAQIRMGKKIGLAHAKTTVVNDKLLDNDITNVVDYLSRVASLPQNTVFISTNATAKKLLQSVENLTDETGLKLEQLVAYNDDNIYVMDTSLEAFYNGYYGKSHSSLMGYVETFENEEKSFDNEKNDSKSKTEQGGKVQNNGKAVLLKNGKLVKILDIETLNGINILNPKAKNQIIRIKDVGKEKFQLNYKVKNKKILLNTSFQNGYPLCICQVVLGVELVEVNGEHQSKEFNTEFSNMNNEIKQKINVAVKKQFTNSIIALKEANTDILGIENRFHRYNRKELKQFFKFNQNYENFFSLVNFKINIIIKTD